MGIPINEYDPNAAVSRQLVKVQSIPSCAEQRANEKDGWKADIPEIRRRRICHLELYMSFSFRKPKNLVELLRGYYAVCLILW